MSKQSPSSTSRTTRLTLLKRKMESPFKLTLSPEDHGKIFAVAHVAAPPGVPLRGAHTIDLRCSYERGRDPIEKYFRTTDFSLYMGMLIIGPVPKGFGKRTLDIQGAFKSPQNTMTVCPKFTPPHWIDVGSRISSREMKLKVVEFAIRRENDWVPMMSLYIVVFPNYDRTFNVLGNTQQI